MADRIIFELSVAVIVMALGGYSFGWWWRGRFEAQRRQVAKDWTE